MHQGMTVRGDDDLFIARPVPDEVIAEPQPVVQWTPIEGATRYVVGIEGVENSYEWSLTTTETEIQVPAENILPADTRFRVHVEAIPSHVAPEHGLQSSFRTASRSSWIRYRLVHGPRGARGLGAGGLMSLLAAVGMAFVVRRWPR